MKPISANGLSKHFLHLVDLILLAVEKDVLNVTRWPPNTILVVLGRFLVLPNTEEWHILSCVEPILYQYSHETSPIPGSVKLFAEVPVLDARLEIEVDQNVELLAGELIFNLVLFGFPTRPRHEFALLCLL